MKYDALLFASGLGKQGAQWDAITDYHSNPPSAPQVDWKSSNLRLGRNSYSAHIGMGYWDSSQNALLSLHWPGFYTEEEAVIERAAEIRRTMGLGV